MKLKEWADKTGVKYLTAYRWFKDGSLPVKAYQTDTGTIIVDDSEVHMSSNNDAMSLFLKKTVEYSKSNSTIEDFAAYIISNFNLKLNTVVDNTPKYSRNKPKPEDIQKHFQSFLKPKGSKPTPNIFIETTEGEDQEKTGSEYDNSGVDELIEEFSKLSDSKIVDAIDAEKLRHTKVPEQVDINYLLPLLKTAEESPTDDKGSPDKVESKSSSVKKTRKIKKASKP